MTIFGNQTEGKLLPTQTKVYFLKNTVLDGVQYEAGYTSVVLKEQVQGLIDSGVAQAVEGVTELPAPPEKEQE